MSRNLKILVIEDERVLAHNLHTYFARRSAEVRVASNGQCAIDMVATFTPDVVVLDYGLPGMNGLNAYRELVRRSSRRIGCVLITGFPLERIARASHQRGIRHLLCKPFPLSELRELVDTCVAEASR